MIFNVVKNGDADICESLWLFLVLPLKNKVTELMLNNLILIFYTYFKKENILCDKVWLSKRSFPIVKLAD